MLPIKFEAWLPGLYGPEWCGFSLVVVATRVAVGHVGPTLLSTMWVLSFSLGWRHPGGGRTRRSDPTFDNVGAVVFRWLLPSGGGRTRSSDPTLRPQFSF
jgi:hypothetical protein